MGAQQFDKTDHELLLELLEDKRKRDRNRKIKIVLWIIVAVVVGVLLMRIVPNLIKMYESYQHAMQQIESITEQYQNIQEIINNQDFSGYQEAIEQIQEYSQFFDGLFGGGN
ncbi:MAG: hypothetical protein IKE51_00785 [Solobacterium sp.]|nr:hypothetical protein [Solobacterium sp.]